jgi:hypothetical protein
VVERDSREIDECLFVARRPNYIDGGSKKKRMAVCIFVMGWKRDQETHIVWRGVCVSRERGRRGPE